MNDKPKESFVAFYEWADAIAELPDEVQAKFFRCMFYYAKTGELKEPMNQMEMIAWRLIQSSIDRQQAKYERVCERRREAGKKGGAPKGNQNARKENNQNQAKQANDSLNNQNQAKQANDSLNNQNQAKQAFHNDNDNEIHIENENENENDIVIIDNKLSTTTTTINNNIKASLSKSLLSKKINRGDFESMWTACVEVHNEIVKLHEGKKRDLTKLLKELQKYEVDSWRDVARIYIETDFADLNNPVFDSFKSFKRRKALPENINTYLLTVAKSKE